MLTIVAALLGLLTLAGLGYAFVGPGDSAAKGLKRVQAMTGDAPRTRARTMRQAKDASATPEARRKQIMAQLKEAEQKDRKNRVSIGARLRQAGLSVTVRTFWIASGVVGLVVATLVILFGQAPFIALGLGFAAAFGLPRWVVGFLAERRAKKFGAEFPNAVDIIVRGIKSGLPVHDCLKMIGKECSAPLGPEFQTLVETVSMGVPLDQALEKMYERMPTPELRFFTIVIGIQQKTGGNLAEALANLSTVLRARKLMREKIKAMSSEATASAGIIGSLPPGVMVIVSLTTPSYMSLMFTDPRGNLMLLGGALWMAMGIFVMKRMISFKI
jgi:tight adherence protein B